MLADKIYAFHNWNQRNFSGEWGLRKYHTKIWFHREQTPWAFHVQCASTQHTPYGIQNLYYRYSHLIRRQASLTLDWQSCWALQCTPHTWINRNKDRSILWFSICLQSLKERCIVHILLRQTSLSNRNEMQCRADVSHVHCLRSNTRWMCFFQRENLIKLQFCNS